MRKTILILAFCGLIFSLVGCSPISNPLRTSVPDTSIQLDQSSLTRISNPQVSNSDQQALVSGNSTFAVNLLQFLNSQSGNLIFSPFSISEALAMTYAGARGETEQQMASALHFTLPQNNLHSAFNALDQKLNGLSTGQSGSDQNFQLNIVNSIWGQKGFTFLPAFLDILSQNYGAGVRLLDFENATEPSRQEINNWVSDQTQQKIQDLLPEGSVLPTTRMVLTNAVYFKAEWEYPFQAGNTQNRPFTLADATQVDVPTMHEAAGFGYAESGGVQVVDLPYANSNMSMVIFLPENGSLDSFVNSLTTEKITDLLNSLSTTQEVSLDLPKFKFDASFNLNDALSTLGMPDAFTSGKADFSGMDGKKDLLIQGVLHKAFIAVDEQGTEAAAATGVVVGLAAIPVNQVTVKVDHPFLFMIVDHDTGTVLFLGRVVDPR
jgi:serpin B